MGDGSHAPFQAHIMSSLCDKLIESDESADSYENSTNFAIASSLNHSHCSTIKIIMTEISETDFPPGIAMVHSNRMEDLRSMLLGLVKGNPLPPFEQETVLLQSNGIRQWLKLGFAGTDVLGISADTDYLLPSPFIWECYRILLPDLKIQTKSALDRGPLTWRLFRMMDETFASNPALYAPLIRFIKDKPHPIKRYQLATQLADLLDQYQVHRADWLLDWANPNSEHHNRIRLKAEEPSSMEIPADLQWQPALWRKLIEDLGIEDWSANSRSTLHESLLARIDEIACGERERPPALPRRIIVFGISSLPRQTLETLGKLGTLSQVLFFVHNPCQHYWGNIIEGADLLKSERFKFKDERQASANAEDLHLFGNPLLAAWGKQGRDFIQLLDQWDQLDFSNAIFKTDFSHFPDTEEGADTLLKKVQWGIVNLDPAPKETSPITPDDSLTFHIAHSPQREVEILHDQLLKIFDTKDGVPSTITPREVIVMLPDIDKYAPHIDAVFGRQVPGEDAPPLIPYSIADRKSRGHNPIYKALETLLRLPESRFTASEVMDLLDVEALQRTFGLKTQDIPVLQRWIRESGVRWGLDPDHRMEGGHLPKLKNPSDLNQNTWEFGLDRLFMGYALGAGEPLEAIAPYKEIGGIESRLLGSLHALIKALKQTAKELRTDGSPLIWKRRFTGLLDTYFDAENPSDERSLAQIRQSLEDWLEDCHSETFDAELPLIVAREAWSGYFDQPRLTQQFLSGNVHFCTLMPMRSIPFKVVCLVGMNAGDYPRQQPPRAFDLLQRKGVYRPGDRSRRDDDRYMLLEALLSAREKLLVSWVGRSIRDNQKLEASVLVNQLRDYLTANWHLESAPPKEGHKGGATLLEALTTEYPLQPFSQAYLEHQDLNGRLFTYAHEWFKSKNREAHKPSAPSHLLPLPDELEALSLRSLCRFLKNPSEHFFNRRLNVYFERAEDQIEDDETFTLNALESYLIKRAALKVDLTGDVKSNLQKALEHQRLEGRFPLAASGEILSDEIQNTVLQVVNQEKVARERWQSAKHVPLELGSLTFIAAGHTLILEDWLTDLYPHASDPQRFAAFHRAPSDIQKDGKPRLDKALDLWVNQLAANAAGIQLESYLIGSDAVIHIPCLKDPEEAHALLSKIVLGWLEGLRGPLPVAPKTAFAYLLAKAGAEENDAKKAYDSAFMRLGECDRSPYLQRSYPVFEDLTSGSVGAKGLKEWLEALYAPLVKYVNLIGDEA